MSEDAGRYLDQEVASAMAEAGEQPGIFCRCGHCKHRLAYQPSAVRLTWLVEKHAMGQTVWAYYEFFCMICHQDNRHPLTPDVALLLAQAGVVTRSFDYPSEMREHPADAPVLTQEDVDAFVARLSAGV